MTQQRTGRGGEEAPGSGTGDTALDEALTELAEAETGSPAGDRRKWGRAGEAGDALTPNERAQDDAQESAEREEEDKREAEAGEGRKST
ncbi:hypothetical protein P8605_41950 [Streptomyces sp. T-3]|nr:hypothetical protein [Streptomyces sp. T-3]